MDQASQDGWEGRQSVDQVGKAGMAKSEKPAHARSPDGKFILRLYYYILDRIYIYIYIYIYIIIYIYILYIIYNII